MSVSRLTTNGVAAAAGGDLDLKPVLQIVEVRRVGGAGAQERYRAVISDGGVAMSALLAAQLNGLARSGLLHRGTVVQLLEYMPSTVQNRRIIIILNLEVLLPECEIVGNPKLPQEAGVVAQNDSSANPGHIRVEPLKGASRSGSITGNFSNIATKPNDKGPVFQPTVQPSYRPPPNYKNHGAIMKNEAPARIIPVAALNPYQGCWAIKARVTAKGDIRRYNNAKGDGKVFSFDLLDSDGGEIRVTCFNAVVDRFYEIVEAGKVYVISKGALKPARKNFNHLNNEWEIFLESASTVEPCPDESSSIPAQRFNFRPISEIEDAQNNSILDIIGIVISVNPTATILRKNGMETQRRVINLKDMSGRSVELTMWSEFCNKEGLQLQEMLDSGTFPVLAVKAGKVNDFSGKSVGTISSTQLFINPDLPEAHSLRKWFDRGGKNASAQSISRDVMPAASRTDIRKTVSQIKEEGLGMGDKPDWVTVKATVSFIKADNFCYTACPLMIGDRQCSKKVTRVASGCWCCDRCDKEFDECDYRYLLQLQVQDYTGMTWVTAFQESGEDMLGCSAKELYMLKEQEDPRFAEIMRHSLFEEYLLRLKIKEESYGEEQRVKITVVKAEKVNPSTESRYLVDLISRFPA